MRDGGRSLSRRRVTAAPRPNRGGPLHPISLNGELNATTDACACYPPWTGVNCSALSLLPATRGSGYGVSPNRSSTWGGNAVRDGGGVYHLFVAQMEYGCTLADWATNSACVHATSATAEGPYAYQDTALPVWCHNPQVVAYDDGSGGTAYALFHIGTGTPSRPPAHCNGTGAGPATAASTAPTAANASTVHTAASPSGPWEPVLPAPPACNNPAPLRLSNGTWYTLCANGGAAYTLLASSGSGLAGPWRAVAEVPSAGGPPGTWEDPFLWVDPRGHWHVLGHVWNKDVLPQGCATTCRGTRSRRTG